MNALQQLQMTAGQRGHEDLYSATFIWNGNEYPCVPTETLKNPQLITGGQSPSIHVTLTVRSELFDQNILPKKEDLCSFRQGKDQDLALKIQSIETSVGSFLQTIVCTSVDQNA